jgi:competence ComEA-like helix-hairpin-helix protein
MSWPARLSLLLVAVVLAGAWSLAWHRTARAPHPADPRPAVATGQRIDLNAADAPTLQLLPGIGRALARRVVSYRAQHGPFKSLDALLEVYGLAPATVERLAPFVVAMSSDRAPSTEPDAPTAHERSPVEAP